MKNYLNFEADIKNLEIEIEKLKDPYNQDGLSEVDTKKISESQKEIDNKLQEIYSNLDPWQTTLVAYMKTDLKQNFLSIIYLRILYHCQVIDFMEKTNPY